MNWKMTQNISNTNKSTNTHRPQWPFMVDKKTNRILRKPSLLCLQNIALLPCTHVTSQWSFLEGMKNFAWKNAVLRGSSWLFTRLVGSSIFLTKIYRQILNCPYNFSPLSPRDFSIFLRWPVGNYKTERFIFFKAPILARRKRAIS